MSFLLLGGKPFSTRHVEKLLLLAATLISEDSKDSKLLKAASHTGLTPHLGTWDPQELTPSSTSPPLDTSA